MFTKEEIILTIIMAGESIIGILANGYIGLIFWIDSVKKKKIPSFNYILTNLAVSRICLLFIIVVGDIVLILYPDFYENVKLVIVLSVFWIFTNYSSLWFATCLNVFYLLKIANFSSPLFLWLKWRIDRATFWILLLGLAVCSLSSCLTAIPNFYKDSYGFTEHQRNVTEMFHVSEIEYLDPSDFFNLLAIVPIAVSLISFFLLILSLWRHIKQMKLNASGWRDPSTEAHITAMKNVTSFLFLLFLYYGACLLVTYSNLMRGNIVSGLGKIIEILYPTGHSLILIIGNSKLKQAFVRILRCGGGVRGTACLM
ncbi:taste receptor type 2 member 8-like [Sorex fumeus]|uniref:taste receptor type 2 member 8-like n=1 Tax=Sorex fumeus TaxID=62283 RepID=UPI0024ACF4D3|nr:taste receptor type 2 member 8-like [Sorex fumeus]